MQNTEEPNYTGSAATTAFSGKFQGASAQIKNLLEFAKGEASSKQLAVLIGLLVGVILLMAIIFAYTGIKTANEKQYVGLAGEQRLLSQRMVKYATEASSAKVDAFPLLGKARDRFQEILDDLQDSSGSVDEELEAVARQWEQFTRNAGTILAAEATIRMLSEFIAAINDTMPRVVEASEDAAKTLASGGAGPELTYTITRQLLLAQRVSYNANRILQGGEGASEALAMFTQDVDQFYRVINSMVDGGRVSNPRALDQLREAQILFRAVKDISARITAGTPELVKAQVAANSMFASSDTLLETTTRLTQAYDDLGTSVLRVMLVTLGYALGLIALLLLVWLGYRLIHETRRRLVETRQHNQRTEQAIQNLLTEIQSLAGGDLTVQATVTNDITGPIAERFNFALDALRKLVSTINDTVVQVSSAAAETQATAVHLAEASDNLAHQITAAVAASNEMAVSVEQVSGHAAESSEVARKSVAIANKGAASVQDTIGGMDRIREQIQETSKRIKRLGESSQEIGEIVGLINELADQTNILAINAAIQAAMAGESGHGFAAVADEVQRLAERSADALRQIETLVNAIQSDTNGAISSMEKSTSEVVNGTRLAQVAGEALTEIETVSGGLAQLIHSISDTARQQAMAASDISSTMNNIQELTLQTAAGTTETAASVGNLAEMANELRGSVAGFKVAG